MLLLIITVSFHATFRSWKKLYSIIFKHHTSIYIESTYIAIQCNTHTYIYIYIYISCTDFVFQVDAMISNLAVKRASEFLIRVDTEHSGMQRVSPGTVLSQMLHGHFKTSASQRRRPNQGQKMGPEKLQWMVAVVFSICTPRDHDIVPAFI